MQSQQQVVFGAVSAAHGLVRACRILAGTNSPAGSPSSFSATSNTLFSAYSPRHLTPNKSPSLALRVTPPARALFDAAAVCGWAALRYPAEVFAPGAREGLSAAVTLLRGDANVFVAWTGRGEALRVLEGLARRAGIPNPGCNGASVLPTPPMPGILKRKHSMVNGASEGQDGKAESTSLAATRDMLRDGKGLKDKEREKEKAQERKKRAGYPPVGIRVRAGKDGGPASPVSPLGLGRKTSVSKTVGSPLGVVPPPPRTDDMGYYSQQPQRASSIPQTPSSMEYNAVSTSSLVPLETTGSMDYSRRSFSDAPPSQQQGYAGDSTSSALYDLPRAGSYDADSGAAAYTSAGSPYGSSSNGNAGALSQANSPYTTSASAGISTPTFGANSAHHPSPPYPASPQVQAPGAYYTPGTYESQYEPQLAIDIPAPPLYEKHTQMYEVKPGMDHRYQLEQESRHGLPWQSPDEQQQQSYQWPTDDFKFYAQ
ncbi:hypothetical protein FB45DRAFT_41930 [Roridomyces roridus]|uniref:Uncharacterized protein n=1 Tax=Roridomyces roridus TaxID=1738132 RepID=A0AAD7FMF5_9AGAR|nr:hypothetical protein FB45DRAFT_41930 [Roridomyces roridus]